MAGGVGGIGTMTSLADEEDKKEIVNQFDNGKNQNGSKMNMNDKINFSIQEKSISNNSNNALEKDIEINSQKNVQKVISSNPSKTTINKYF